jgi:stage V sporulation protein B
MANIAKDSTILMVAFLVTSIFDYIFNVSLGWLLSPEDYGTYGVSIAFLLLLSLFVNSGFPWATAKYLSEENDKKIKYKVFKSSLVANFFIAITVSILFLLTYLFLLRENYTPILTVIILVTIVSSFRFTYQKALQGFFMFKETGTIQIIDVFIKLVLGVGLVYLGFGVLGALMGFLISGLVSLMFMAYLLRNFKFWRGNGWIDFRVFSFAMPTFFGMLAIALFQNIDILGVKFLTEEAASDELAGYYQAALVLARIPIYLVGVVMIVLFPFISKYSKSGNENYSSASLKFSILFIFPIVLAVSLIPESFIRLMYPEVYTRGSGALSIVALGMGFLGIIYILTQIFQGMGRPRVPVGILVPAVIIQIILLLILTPKAGLMGAASATTLACLFGMVLLIRAYRKISGFTFKKRQAAALILAYVVAGTTLFFFPHDTRIFTLIDIVISGIIYIFMLLILKLVKEKEIDILLSAMPDTEKTRRLSKSIKLAVIRLNNITKSSLS